MNDTLIFLAFITFLSTLVGGAVAIRFRKVLVYIFAYAAGALVAVAFLDILPESIELAESVNLSVRYVMITAVASFFFYSVLEKFFLSHHHHETDSEHGHIMGPIGAGGLVIHSFLDGVSIGAAYAVNPAVGLIVASAVIFHDFTDGINTVTLMLKNRHHVKNAAIFLLMDALAPVAGVLSASFFTLNQNVLPLILAAFVGEFVYIGASHLLPETHKHTAWKVIPSMGLGIFVIFILTSLI